jgi:hypothetical protein
MIWDPTSVTLLGLASGAVGAFGKWLLDLHNASTTRKMSLESAVNDRVNKLLEAYEGAIEGYRAEIKELKQEVLNLEKKVDQLQEELTLARVRQGLGGSLDGRTESIPAKGQTQ